MELLKKSYQKDTSGTAVWDEIGAMTHLYHCDISPLWEEIEKLQQVTLVSYGIELNEVLERWLYA